MLIYSTNINSNINDQILNLSQYLNNIITKNTIFICVGTDKLIFDSLGPLVGHLLKSNNNNNLYVYGDLKNPLTASNLSSEIIKIKSLHPNNHILTIDASLNDNIGCIKLLNEPLKPINNNISFGNHKLIGIVDSNNNPNPLHLNVRLFTIFTMAEIISKSIITTINNQNI